MATIQLRFFQITLDIKEREVSQEDYDKLRSGELDNVDFVWNSLTDDEKSQTMGEKWNQDFIDNTGIEPIIFL